MTTKDTADRTPETIDFTMMYVTHDAFQRDLGRFTAAAAAGMAHATGVRAGWQNVKAQLLLHHMLAVLAQPETIGQIIGIAT